jgi:hypothetical protein
MLLKKKVSKKTSLLSAKMKKEIKSITKKRFQMDKKNQAAHLRMAPNFMYTIVPVSLDTFRASCIRLWRIFKT